MPKLAKGVGGRARVLIPDQTAGGGGGAPASSVEVTFVFRPGGVTSKNVYATWAALVAAESIVAGPKAILFDSSLAPCVIPAGAWNLGNDPVLFTGMHGFNDALQIDGTLTGQFALDIERLFVTYTGAVPCLVANETVNQTYRFRGNGDLTTTGGAAFLRITGPSVTVFLEENFAIFGGLAIESIGGAGVGGFITADAESIIGANTLGSDFVGNLQVNRNSPAATVQTMQGAMPGGVLVVGTTLFNNAQTSNMTGPGGGSPALVSGSAKIDGLSGKSPFIPCPGLTTSSRIVALVRDPLGAGGGTPTSFYGASLADRVFVPAPIPGFQISAFTGGGPGLNIADNSDLDWQVTN
jgi:hypothetical protein